jgi:hypothetical protein
MERSSKSPRSNSKARNQNVTAAQVRKMIDKAVKKNLETHFTVATDSANTVDYAGEVKALTSIAQGDGDSARTGDSVTMQSLSCKYVVTLGDVTNIFRIVVFIWKPATTPTIDLILDQQGAITSPLSSIVHDYAPSFRVIYDKLITLDAAHVTVIGSFKIPLKNHVMDFIAGSTTV